MPNSPAVSPQCLICNSSCLSVRNSIQIFANNATDNLLNLPRILESLLGKQITQASAHSTVVCKKCYKLIDEFDELQQRVTEIKSEITENHKATLQIKDESADESKSNNHNVKNEIKINVQELPKKILDIPSSDEESPSGCAKTFEEIEMALVKIHQDEGESDSNVMDMETNEGQSLRSFQEANSDSDCEEFTSGGHTPPNDENTAIKMEPNTEESNGEFSQDTITKPNILKRKRQTNGVSYTDNAIKEPDHTNINVPVVTREGNIYTCLLCTGDQTVAGEAKSIIAHMKEAHDTRLYICDVCGMDFRRRNYLSAHVDEHVANEEGDFQCEVCNRIFNNLRLFRIHRRMHLPHTKAWVCSTCGKRYSSKNLLEEHTNTHLGVRPYVCSSCGKGFASKYTFRAHEKTHETRPRPYKCEQCGKSFLSQQNLGQHEKIHTGVKDYQCHLCNKRFGSAHNLEVHSIVHTGYKPYICGLCGKAFARKAEIRDHERTHTGERPFQCEFCGATFSQRSNLQSHKRATHYDDKRYRCQDCGKCFKRRRLLDYHIKAAHTGERPYKCDICEATFVYPEHFKKHRRIHTGEKPYMCEVCGKAFNSRDNRNAHRFVHSDKKPYECLVCGIGFMRKPLLYQHMQMQGHLNDTIVVNQPRLTLDDKIDMDTESHVVAIAEIEEEPKIFIDGTEDNDDQIIIDGRKIAFVADSSENEEDAEEVVDEIEQVIATDEDYEEILSSEAITAGETQIIDTEDGPIQLVKVKINENGKEEEAWIKIVPEET